MSLSMAIRIKKLDISYNPIKWMPDLFTLKYLDCSNTLISTLPYCPNLVILKCRNTPITRLPFYPNLESLDARNSCLIEIPTILKLKELNAENCPLDIIQKLPTRINNYKCKIINWNTHKIGPDYKACLTQTILVNVDIKYLMKFISS